MSKLFDPRKVLRQVSNIRLRDFFSHRDELTDVAWDGLEEHQVGPIYDAWQALPDAKRREVHVVLEDIHELADSRGLALLAEEIAWREPSRVSEFDAIEGHADKALWVWLNVPTAFTDAAMFARAIALSTGRYWEKRNGLPHVNPVVDDEIKERLAEELTGFFGPEQARGHYCHVEHYVRATGQHYFFAYLDDYPDQRVSFDDAGQFRRRPERGAFDLVFVFNPSDGTLEMFAQGGRKVRDPLQQRFCKAVLDLDVEPAAPQKPAFEIQMLKNPSFAFTTEPQDGVQETRIRAMRIEPVNAPARSITLRADPKGNARDIHQCIDAYLNSQQLPRSSFRVTMVTLQITFVPVGNNKPKTLSFDISLPGSSNLKSKPDDVREIAERLLKRWGITP